jgi:hypothetical protein
MDEIYWYSWFIDYWMEGGESLARLKLILEDGISNNIDLSMQAFTVTCSLIKSPPPEVRRPLFLSWLLFV